MGGYIKMDLKEIGRKDVDWIDLPPDRGKWQAVVKKIPDSIQCGENRD
jgi:hypothetical protein